MKKLDLTNPDDILEFANNYEIYKGSISLPKPVKQEINNSVKKYQVGYITYKELGNCIAMYVVEFMEYLDVEIKRNK